MTSGLAVSNLRHIWAALPVPDLVRGSVRRAVGKTVGKIRRHSMQSPPDPQGIASGPLVVSGFLSETFGIGKGARLTRDQLRRLGLPVRAHDIGPMLESGDDRLEILFAEAPGGVWITH